MLWNRSETRHGTPALSTLAKAWCVVPDIGRQRRQAAPRDPCPRKCDSESAHMRQKVREHMPASSPPKSFLHNLYLTLRYMILYRQRSVIHGAEYSIGSSSTGTGSSHQALGAVMTPRHSTAHALAETIWYGPKAVPRRYHLSVFPPLHQHSPLLLPRAPSCGRSTGPSP